ncbi:Phage tail sheath protein [Shewanella psychrophila]|uniref:Phage tail sheath protein n=1 Tax=Shewanella psychrophila TaxID=225848 RepID=A0A1S6HM92_9GAMM|nr:phage tail sheath C-terminal domain-containing protein [Shewanella psychrophila]AQS36646.1 Phage tail sheath protein [Shewanella psychrophila]
MTTTTTYPGVYIEEQNRLSLSVSHSNTAIPAFAVKTGAAIGFGSDKAKRLDSYMDYQKINIDPDADVNISAGSTSAMLSLKALGLNVSQPFLCGLSVSADLTAEFFMNGEPVPRASHETLVTADSVQYSVVSNLNNPADHVVVFSQDGLPLQVTHKVHVYPASITDVDNCMRVYFNNGGGTCYLIPVDSLLTEVPKHDDITLLVQAGVETSDFSDAVNTLTGLGSNLFAIYDGPNEAAELTIGTSVSGYGGSAYTAVYYPWLQADWTVDDIPPSAAIAGAYCKNDNTVGVWKAPANMTLAGVTPKYKVTDTLQGAFTQGDGRALNMIRQFNNGPTTIWGARTRDDSDQWRYVPVRRLFSSAEKDIKDAMKVAMFEPNSQPTWEAVRASVTSYLTKLWKNGALMGTKPEEAFFVQVGKGITMDMDDIKQGKMIVKVGMAAVRPAEFIILQFTQDVAQ